MKTLDEVSAELEAVSAQLIKVQDETRPSIAAAPISDSPQALFKGMTGTYRVMRIPKGAQVIALPGGDFILAIDASMKTGGYWLDWKLSSGVTGSKAFSVI